jgi:squalene-hopene/tetraprenyl-beta-curcumene cyclase
MAVVALGAPRDPKYDPVRLALRRSLLRSTGSGGFGSGADGAAPPADLETTQWALRALRGMEPPTPGPGGREDPETRVRQASGFVWACQVATNAAAPETRGGFRRTPEAGAPDLASTCDGILAALFLGTATGDDRLALAMDWIQRRMALELRTGGNELDRFRGMPSCAMALSAIRQDLLRHPDGRIEDWRYALAKRLLDLQEGDGRWGSPLLTEDQRNRVTAQAAFALELVFHALDH